MKKLNFSKNYNFAKNFYTIPFSLKYMFYKINILLIFDFSFFYEF